VTERLLAALATWLLVLSRHILPGGARDWAAAMEGELAAIKAPGRRLVWAAGCLRAALGMRAASADGRFKLLCGLLLALLTLLDWNSPDPSLTIALLAFLPVLLAYSYPLRSWRIGLVFGLWLLAAHWLADFSASLRPSYQLLPLSLGELVEIAALVGITLPAAWLGARLRLAAS
jgi:hypothetical protein